eukprot:CAMPEP_0180483958 /NCGR_PEP_ID=MMETSP1036_2-20121128/35693_1 /TAXON_ID=632150 /ORGANISM="Azadinium spinosum, Strain 3D9" /LENGTH=70 /DNA_ID=CAMNT_0022491787 /DNA_START=128 /DNA_END=340 /DNA_ORIENTATION=-
MASYLGLVDDEALQNVRLIPELTPHVEDYGDWFRCIEGSVSLRDQPAQDVRLLAQLRILLGSTQEALCLI